MRVLCADLTLFLDTGSKAQRSQCHRELPEGTRGLRLTHKHTHRVPPATPLQSLTGAGADVRHVDEGPRVLDQSRMMQRDARAKALGIHRLAELCVSHWDRGFVIPWGKNGSSDPLDSPGHTGMGDLPPATRQSQGDGSNTRGAGPTGCILPAPGEEGDSPGTPQAYLGHRMAARIPSAGKGSTAQGKQGPYQAV